MPISFDDEQMAQIMSAAMPLPVAQAQIEGKKAGGPT
jgi:hypothetical protein